MEELKISKYIVINRKTCVLISDFYVDIKQVDYKSSSVENIYDLSREDFYALMFHVLKKNIVTFLSDFKDEKKYKEIFLIPSVINTTNNPFYESEKRSIFTHQERFEQTLETIKSIKPSPCFLLEGSKLSFSQIIKLAEAGVDKIILCCEGIGDEYANKNKNKSMYELYVLSQLFPKISADFYIKLGGRYKIIDRQDIYDSEKATFKPVKGYGNYEIIECIHYSIPLKLRDVFVQLFKEFITILSTVPGQCIENIFTQALTNNTHLWKPVKYLGIIGRDAMIGREYFL